ncbi:class I SAM-dependent methyltransferase [Pararhodospirillum photometricum]|nr:class I SAM-dependent methyltransferase [Pararhodospirillum photometricum]
MTAFRTHITEEKDKALLWRMHTLLWGARKALALEGDFVECACYKGNSARVLCEALRFETIDKKYYLYDLFEHDQTMPHHELPAHSKELYGAVQARFRAYNNVIVTQGRVPEILAHVAPEKIAFLHLDLNNTQAELGALELLFDRLVPGAVLVLDDYGWSAYKDQKDAEDLWFAARGYSVLELPTGQGLLIK